MPYEPLRSRPVRRTALTMVLCSAALLLGACATPPAAAPSRAQALQSLGFRLTDVGWEFSLDGKLLFNTDSDRLDSAALSTISRLGRELGLLEIDHLRVEGHTDSVGSAAYNRALSLRRAQAVASAMAQAGLRDAKIEVYGLGMALPVSDNDTAERRLQNRRVAVIVPAQ